MSEFSYEKFKAVKTNESLSKSAMGDIKTVEKILARGTDLFTEQDENELEKLKMLYPDEFDAVKDMEPFYDLNPEQQKEVLKRIEKDGIEAFIKMRQGKQVETLEEVE